MPCREHLAQLRGQEEAFGRLGVAIVVVTFEPPDAVAGFAARERLPFPILSDPTRRAYAAFGLTRGPTHRVWGWRTLYAYLRGLGSGTRPRRPHGDLAQLGGDFVLDAQGSIVFAHRSTHPADRPPIQALLAAVCRAAGANEHSRE